MHPCHDLVFTERVMCTVEYRSSSSSKGTIYSPVSEFLKQDTFNVVLQSSASELRHFMSLLNLPAIVSLSRIGSCGSSYRQMNMTQNVNFH